MCAWCWSTKPDETKCKLTLKKKKSCASVGYTSEDDVSTFFFFAAAFACVSERRQSRQWGDGSERVREQCVPVCPLSWGSNFTPWNPLALTLHPYLTPPHPLPSGSQFPPGGAGAASRLAGRQEAQGPLHRQQVRSHDVDAAPAPTRGRLAVAVYTFWRWAGV